MEKAGVGFKSQQKPDSYRSKKEASRVTSGGGRGVLEKRGLARILEKQ